MSGGTKFQTELLEARGSAAKRYREVVLGSSAGWGAFAYYEIATLLASNLGGATGLALRALLYRPLFARMGTGVVLGRGLVLRHPRRIALGSRVMLDEQCVLDAKESEKGIEVGDGALLSRETILACKGGPIRLGARVNIGVRCTVSSVGGVEIGDETLLAGGCYVGGGRYRLESREQSIASQGSYSDGPVVIGPGCWLGAHAVVLDGVRLGRGVVVASGAVVTADVPDYSIVGGVPARLIRTWGES